MEELLASYPELERKRNIVSVATSSPSTFHLPPSPQVQCSLSGHEMPARLGVVRAYVEGKKFQKLKAERDFKFQRLEPFIKPSLKRKWVELLSIVPSALVVCLSVHPPSCCLSIVCLWCMLCRRQLFCALTNRYMNRKPAEVTLHLQGKRYRRAMEKCEQLVW